MDPMDPKFIRWVRSAPEIGLRSFHDCGLHNWNLRIFICIYMYLYVFTLFTTIFHIISMNKSYVIYWVSWAALHISQASGLWSLAPGAETPGQGDGTARASSPRGSTFTATRWGQNGSSCTSTLLWLPCPRLGLLDQLDQLHSWAVVKRQLSACQPLTFKPPNHQTVTLSSYAPSRHTTSRILRASFWVLQVWCRTQAVGGLGWVDLECSLVLLLDHARPWVLSWIFCAVSCRQERARSLNQRGIVTAGCNRCTGHN